MGSLPHFADRNHAGQELARALAGYARHAQAVVLALPRGGVPVGFAIAQVLELELDILMVRKLGLPGHEEYAMGAIASGGVRVLNREAVVGCAVPDAMIDAVCERELAVICEREHMYRGDHPPLLLHGRIAILVDDGLATGSTMRVAVEVARTAGAARVVAAVPVGPPEACAALEDDVDELVCLSRPPYFRSVGQWYEDFSQTDDAEVQHLLALARHGQDKPQQAPAPAPASAPAGSARQ